MLTVVQLYDAAFDGRFRASPVLNTVDLQSSLPQVEGCWDASTAQSWSSHYRGYSNDLRNNNSAPC